MTKPFAIDLWFYVRAGFFAGVLLVASGPGCSTLNHSSASSSNRIVLDHRFPWGVTPEGRAHAVVAAAFDFWGVDLAPNALPQGEVGLAEFLSDLTVLGDVHGLCVSGFSGSMEHVESVLAGGCPVLVVRGTDPAQLHLALVVGFDHEARSVYLHEGRFRYREITRGSFLRSWQPRRQFMIILAPPGRADWTPMLPEVFSTGEYWARRGAWERAAAVYAEGRAIAPENMGLLYGQASVWERALNWNEAEKIYREVLIRDPLQARAANNLSHALGVQAVQGEEDLFWAKRAATIDPGNAVYLATLGIAQERAGQLGEAVSSLEKAHHRAGVLTQARQREILNHLVRVYQAAGQDHLARQVIEAYRKLDASYDPATGP